MKKQFLLTGATGALGSCVSAQLAGTGAAIRALVLPGDRSAARLPDGVERVEGDLLDDGALERLFSVPAGTETTVLHMAAVVTVEPGFDRRTFDVNVAGTENVLRFCERTGVKKLVYVSSSSAIPERPAGEVQTEPDSFDPDAVVGAYSRTKAEATRAVMAAAGRGLDASVVFPTGLCGPGDLNGPLTGFVADCAGGRVPAGVAGTFDMVDVRDAARGVILCAEKGRPGEGYLLSGTLLTIRELMDLASRLGGARRVRTVLPRWAARPVLPILRLTARIRRQKPVFTAVSLYNLERNNRYSAEKAVRELGFSVRPPEETVADTVAWLRETGRLTGRAGRRDKTKKQA